MINMKAKFTDDQLKVGTIFKGNVNGAICEIVKIENPITSYQVDWKGDAEPIRNNKKKIAIIKDCNTGRVSQYDLEMLKRCDITIEVRK